MKSTVTLFQYMPYGAPELQSVARPYMARALVLSAFLSILSFASLGLLRFVPTGAPAPLPRVFTLDRLPPPPAVEVPSVVPPVAPSGPAARAGEVVPVPDAEASPTSTIASQDELGRASSAGAGTGETPITIAPEPEPPLPTEYEYVYTEQLPDPIRMVKPEYPAIAHEAGVTGRVVVRVLVGRDGRVLDARVDDKVRVPMLDEAALAAARQWVFQPALASGKPVAVWVSIPFDFRLD